MAAVWVGRYDLPASDNELDRLTAQSHGPIDLHKESPDAVIEAFICAAQNLYIPCARDRKIIRRVAAIARAHAARNYSCERHYVQQLMTPTPWGQNEGTAVCLTALAGDGKSALLGAIGRLLSPVSTVSVTGIRNISLRSLWPGTLRRGGTMKDVLEPAVPFEESRAVSIGSYKQYAQKLAWRDGVCLMSVDEFQFITKGSAANSRATALLLDLMTIGPVLLYATNYSLGHRLLKRNQEDRDRLLSTTLTMQPLQLEDPDWRDLISGLVSLSPEMLGFDIKAQLEPLHVMTFGIKRKVVRLLAAACRVARSANRRVVTTMDIGRAYRSLDYAIHREDVETLWRQAQRGQSIREDLWCPFQEHGGSGREDRPSNVVQLRTDKIGLQRRINERLMQDAMPPTPRNEGLGSDSQSTRSPNGPVKPKRRPATKEELLGK